MIALGMTPSISTDKFVNGLTIVLSAITSVVQGAPFEESELKGIATQYPAMPRGSADLWDFTSEIPTFASGAPFNDLQFTLLDTQYMDGENSGYDVFLPVDPSMAFPGTNRVQLVRCALNTDLDQVYGSAPGDRIILGTAEIPVPFFIKGPDGVDNDYCVILHFDYEHGHIQLRGEPSDYQVVYCTIADGVATEGWYVFHVAGGSPDLVAFIFPVDDIEPSVSGNPPNNPAPYGPPGTLLSLTNPIQFRYASALPVEPVVPGGVAQFGSAGKEVVGGLAVDSAGNCYLVGSRDRDAGSAEGAKNELFIAKISPSGETAWVTHIPVGEGTMLKAAIADESHLYVAGRTLGALPGFTNAGRWDGILLKLNLESGLVVTTDQWGNAGIDGYGNLALDGAGHLFVSAQGSPPGPASNDNAYLVAKHRTSDLSAVWRQIDPVPVSGFAASAEAWGGLTFVPDTGPGALPGEGRLIVGGWYFAATGANAFAAVYENLGQATPTRAHFLNLTASGIRAEWVMDSTVDEQGRIYLAGFTTGSLTGSGATLLGEGDAFVARYESDFTNPLIHQFGTPRSDLASHIEIDASGRIHVLGYTYGDLGDVNADPDHMSGDVFVSTFDSNLNPLRTRQFGTEGEDRGFLKLRNGTLYIAGMTEGAMTKASHGSFDAFLLALDPEDLHLSAEEAASAELEASLLISGENLTLEWPAENGFVFSVVHSVDLKEWTELADSLTPEFGHRIIRYEVSLQTVRDNLRAYFRIFKEPEP